MFPRIVFILIASALLGAGAAQARGSQPREGFRESFRLEVPASYVAGRPVEVWCARDASVWRAAARTADGDGYAFSQAGISFYPEGVCRTLEVWKPSAPVTSLFGLDLLVLIRESLHVSGLTDAEVTQCEAKKKLAEVAIRFFGFKPRTAKIRKLVRLAHVRSHGIPSAC